MKKTRQRSVSIAPLTDYKLEKQHKVTTCLIIKVTLGLTLCFIGVGATTALLFKLPGSPLVIKPTPQPTSLPTIHPTFAPTFNPTQGPSKSPTLNPTTKPTSLPTRNPTTNPSVTPTFNPTQEPTDSPSLNPTTNPTNGPTTNPTLVPTQNPLALPTQGPTKSPNFELNNDVPTISPTRIPTSSPSSTFCNSFGVTDQEIRETIANNFNGGVVAAFTLDIPCMPSNLFGALSDAQIDLFARPVTLAFEVRDLEVIHPDAFKFNPAQNVGQINIRGALITEIPNNLFETFGDLSIVILIDLPLLESLNNDIFGTIGPNIDIFFLEDVPLLTDTPGVVQFTPNLQSISIRNNIAMVNLNAQAFNAIEKSTFSTLDVTNTPLASLGAPEIAAAINVDLIIIFGAEPTTVCDQFGITDTAARIVMKDAFDSAVVGGEVNLNLLEIPCFPPHVFIGLSKTQRATFASSVTLGLNLPSLRFIHEKAFDAISAQRVREVKTRGLSVQSFPDRVFQPFSSLFGLQIIDYPELLNLDNDIFGTVGSQITAIQTQEAPKLQSTPGIVQFVPNIESYAMRDNVQMQTINEAAFSAASLTKLVALDLFNTPIAALGVNEIAARTGLDASIIFI